MPLIFPPFFWSLPIPSLILHQVRLEEIRNSNHMILLIVSSPLDLDLGAEVETLSADRPLTSLFHALTLLP